MPWYPLHLNLLLDMLYSGQRVVFLVEREVKHMATFEERLQAVERDHAELKKKVELQTIVIRSLVNEGEVIPSLARILQILSVPTQKS